MIRIERFIAKKRMFDLLSLNYVSKFEVLQGENNNLRNPYICKVHIYIQPSDSKDFNKNMGKLVYWGQLNNDKNAVATANMAMKDQFIKESVYIKHPNWDIPKFYKQLITLYSQKYFDIWNHE